VYVCTYVYTHLIYICTYVYIYLIYPHDIYVCEHLYICILNLLGFVSEISVHIYTFIYLVDNIYTKCVCIYVHASMYIYIECVWFCVRNKCTHIIYALVHI